MLKRDDIHTSRTRRSAIASHACCAGWLADKQHQRGNAEERRPSDVTHEAISRQITHLLCRLARLGGKRVVRAVMRAEIVRRHAHGDEPQGQTPAVLTAWAWRLMSSTSASNADRQRPSGNTREAISRQGTRRMCRLARLGANEQHQHEQC